MCRHCRHGEELAEIERRIAPEFYAPPADTRQERRDAMRRLQPAIRAVKYRQKAMRRAGEPTHAIDYEYQMLRRAFFVIQSGGALRSDGSGCGWGFAKYSDRDERF
jgi:hypothetical protein